jgi:hypothetical protein
MAPQGIIHKPTKATFTSHLGDPYSGTMRLGQLSNQLPSGEVYSPQRRTSHDGGVMGGAANSDLYKTKPKLI